MATAIDERWETTVTSGRPSTGAAANINNVESLKKGIITTSKNKAKASYTFLLVGETGVGKSSVFELIANVIAGNDTDHYNFHILDHTNEQSRSNNQSQTNSARLYELTTKNGILIRILDTPGLADTRGLQQDELHKQSIEKQIKNHIDSVNAVLVLANGTVPRVTAGTDYALSTLSAIFPNTLANNIAFMFTNASGPLHWNFSEDTTPNVLKGVPRFLLDNPIALQKKYLKLKNDPNMKIERARLCKAVKAGEEDALEMLVDLFDWLDGLEPQPTTELFDQFRNIKAMIADTHAKHSAAVNQKPPTNQTLKQNHTDTERGVSQAHLGKTRGSLKQMVGLLRKAKVKMQEGIRKVMRISIGK